MADPRPVRIPRRPADAAPPQVEESDRRFWDGESGRARAYVANVAGTARAVRMFGLFALALIAILGVFVLEAATSASPGLADSAAVYGLLAGFTVLLAVVGAWITVLRAPRGAAFGADSVVVTDRLGRRRRWPLPPKLRTHVLQRYGAGLLMGEPTELVELSDGDGHRVNYLVGRGFFDRLDGTS